MDKGIIIGAEHEAATRMNLSFVMFRHVTSVCHLFLAFCFWLLSFNISLVALIHSPYTWFPLGELPDQGSGPIRVQLSAPRLFRSCIGNSIA